MVISLCIATSFAQDVKPTKQETMDWIAGKIKLYLLKTTSCVPPNGEFLMGSNEFSRFENNVITIKNDVNGGTSLIKIDLNNITGDEAGTDYYALTGENVVTHIYDNNRAEVQHKISLFVPGGICYFKIAQFPEEMLVRFRKAIASLSEYNRANKPKEKF